MMTAPKPTKTVSADKMARLQAWNDRKPVIAIMGEFSAGKSTLLNMLIGQAILPTQITATKLPPVWLRYGNEAPYRVDRNNEKHPIDLNNLAAVPLKDTRYIRIFVESEVLESCDLLDTPGISDPNIPMTMWFKTLGYASAALWCTHAGQAWRESERGAWESLPDRLRRHSILLVTRADKITTEIDRMKIDNRLRRETDNLFGARLFISLVNALKALEGEGDADLWAASGAEAFVENLAGAIAAINEDRIVAIRRFRPDPSERTQVAPRRIRPGDTPPAPVARPVTEAPPVMPMGAGADVVPLRPRVVATNEAPMAAATRPDMQELSPENALRGAFRQEPISQPEDDLEADFVAVDDDLIEEAGDFAAMDDDPGLSDAVWPTENVPETIEGDDETFAALAEVAEMGRMPAEEETFEEAVAEAPAAVEEELTIDMAALAEFAEESLPEETTATEDAELDQSDIDFIRESMSLDAHYPDMEMTAVVADPTQDADVVDFDEPEAEVDLDLALLDAEEPPLAAEEAPDLSDEAEDTILAVMAQVASVETPSMPSDTLAAQLEDSQDGDDDDMLDEADEGSASALWRDVLASRPVTSVQDLLLAMTDFVEQLDASGFRLGPNADNAAANPATENTRQLRAQRRAARLARRMRAG